MFLMMSILVASSIYGIGLTRLWRSAGFGRGLPVWRAACFPAGMSILMVTLSNSMDELADKAFSVHMIQHMALINIVAPLLLLSEFSFVLLWAVGKNASHHTAGMWIHSPHLGRFWKRLTSPWVAWTVFAMCLWVWHIPTLYQAALKSELIHGLEHLLFLGTSLLFWWYLLQTRRDQATRYGTVILYLFTTLLHESALGALLTFSSQNWYSFYTVSNPWGLSPLGDQQLAGMIMWLPGGLLFIGLIEIYFAAWLRAIEGRMQQIHPRLMHTGDSSE